MSKLRTHALLFSALLGLTTTACNDSAGELAEEETQADATSTEADTSTSTTDATTTTDATEPPTDTAEPPEDASTPDAVTPITGVPEGPERSEALDTLYCGLDNTRLVHAAVRAGACLEGVSVSGILDDAARGFIYSEMMRSGYGSHYLGNCDVLSCLADATSCAEAQACEDASRNGSCGDITYGSRCDGDTLETCDYDRNTETYHWRRVQDCTRMGATCAEQCDGADCTPRASCVMENAPLEDCANYYGSCDGDSIVRCAPDAFDPTARLEIPCGELTPGGTCELEAVGGEAPGPTCTAPDEDACSAAFGDSSCDPDTGALTLCLYGQSITLSCPELGYATCEGGSFFGRRCVVAE